MKLQRTDALIALLGISVSIAIFIAQGPYDIWWKYFIPAIPLLFAIIFDAAIRLYKSTEGLRKSHIVLRRKYDLMTAVRGTSQMVVRLRNADGDIDYEREYRLELIKNVQVDTTKMEYISSPVDINPMPPKAELLESSSRNQSLTAGQLNQYNEIIDGNPHTSYEWFYGLGVPLTKRGDFIRYRYRAGIPKCESSAFSKDGGIIFVECGAIYITIDVTLVAPPGYSIAILECKTVDYDERERPLEVKYSPQINAAGEILTWTPPYAHGLKYVCRYNCIRK